MPSNTAAYVTAPKAHPLEVRSAPYTSPGEHMVVVKNGAVAINPVDWLNQELGNFVYSWLRYPFVFGCDTAGEVVEVGSKVERFRVGDRIVGLAVGMEKNYNTPTMSAFQEYTVLQEHMASPIPSKLPYEQACVIPLGLSTAACGLYQKDHLALTYPSMTPTPANKTLLVWGGSTSVGCNAIQLAVASGYEVITTASPKNFELLKRLGATEVFDYRSKTVINDIVRALNGKTVAGAFTIGDGATEACLDILSRSNGDKVIAMATYPSVLPIPKRFATPQIAFNFVSWNVIHWFTSKWRRIRTKFIWGGSLIDDGLGKFIFEDFLPEALARGSFVAAPDAHVVGKGLESIQPAFDLQKKGVSATKVVVSL
ncbi:MAG: hypothetical protein Q9218_008245 [Villophora microphyllina]